MTTKVWMVRAGTGGAFIDRFIEDGHVGIGWMELGSIDPGLAREDISDRVAQIWPAYRKGQIASAAGQIFRFLNEIAVEDYVISYDSGQRIYHLGVIQSEPTFDDLLEGLGRIRKVNWTAQIARDRISVTTRNSLGAISTLFLLPEQAAREILELATGSRHDFDPLEAEESSAILEGVREQAKELIKDQINELDPYDLQELVAGVLRAMGYKTRVAQRGADRGIDILASPDGFGFEQPRIIVECKHRPGTAMGAQEIRTFLGGRHKDDKGLYVSTGGFTKEAKYEAERAPIPTTLMDLDQLVNTVTDHYEKLDSETRVLLPLAPIYWPAA